MLLHCKQNGNNFYFVLLSTHLTEYSFKYNYPLNRSALRHLFQLYDKLQISMKCLDQMCIVCSFHAICPHNTLQSGDILINQNHSQNSILNFCGDYNNRNDKYMLVGLECNGSIPAMECDP